ncbi:MAG: DUF1566 domain-containing protein [Chromatiaceae bacterium]|nr:DUF1566 domain-containing protein [Chromatiaceae bacterium]MBP6807639.1 DUF1566 domain-containing protein [Chromatiaceae bacterium]MBP8288311.1 DUF1566 domain-containing protein [Chromatiaceae bacterium]
MTSPESARCPHCFTAPAVTPCPVCGWQPGLNNPPPALALGTLLDGRYRIGRVLGHGGFGITYLAWDDNLHLRLAIKEYLPRDCVSRGPDGVSLAVYSGPAGDQFTYGLDRFLEEARTLAHFDQHPGIVTVKNFFRAHGTGYCVMDYVAGITLRQYLEQQPGGRISVNDALKLLTPVMDALRAVHKEGLLHRDLAPDNIYLTQDGRIKLLDFGAARFAASEHSKSLSIILKPGYAPEEQYRARGKQGPWTDVYGLAATFYRAITGQVPPESLDRLDNDDLVPPSRLGIAITPGQEATLLQALAVKAGQRWQSMAELQQAWRNVDVAAPQPSGEPRGPDRSEAAVSTKAKPVNGPSAQGGAAKPLASDMPPIKKSKTGLVLAVIGVLVILAVVGVVEFGGQEGSRTPALTTSTPAPSPSLAPTGEGTKLSDRIGSNAASPLGAASASAGGASPNERYRFLGKDQEIVEDTRTKLQWQRCSLSQVWTGATCAGEAKTYKWDEAQRIAPAGWRLPTKDELASLVYCSSGDPAYWRTALGTPCKGAYEMPTIWGAAFPNTPKAWFWSSSPYANDSGHAWYVGFDYGYVYDSYKGSAKYMRLVRGSPNADAQVGVTPPDTSASIPVARTPTPPRAKEPDAPPPPVTPAAKAPIYYAAALAPTANIPPEAPLCYRYMVAGPEEQLGKLKAKYPGLYDDQIVINPEGGKNLVAKRRDETGKEITYFYSTSPGVCNTYQKDLLQTPAPPGDREETNAASPPGAAPASAGSDNSPNARYRFLGKDQDIVEDTRTQLQWQRCSLGQTWNGVACAGEAKKYQWDKAKRIAPAGWRLPTKDELSSLVYCSSGEPAYWKNEFGRCEGAYGSPAIWSVAFPNTPASWFWSSSPYAYNSNHAWGVNFDYGLVDDYYKSYAKYVRLVRGGQ